MRGRAVSAVSAGWPGGPPRSQFRTIFAAPGPFPLALTHCRIVNRTARGLAPRLRRLSEKLVYLGRAVQLIWTAAKRWTVVWAVLLAVQGLLPAATVYLTKILVDNLAAALGAGLTWASAQPVLIPALLMGGILLLTEVLHGLLGWVRAAQSELVQDYIKTRIHEQAARVDLAFYETPEQSDRMARANSEASTRSLSLLQNLGGLLQNLLTLLAVAALLVPYSVWLPVVLFVSTVPALWVVLRHNALHHAWWEETTEDRRWAGYYDQVLTYPFPAAELRLFGLAAYFRDGYRGLRRRLRTSRLRLMRNQNLAQFGAATAALAVTAAALAWMATRALRGSATLGDLALFYQAFNQGQRLMRSLLGSVGQLYGDALFLEHLFTFLDLQPTLQSPERRCKANRRASAPKVKALTWAR